MFHLGKYRSPVRSWLGRSDELISLVARRVTLMVGIGFASLLQIFRKVAGT